MNRIVSSSPVAMAAGAMVAWLAVPAEAAQCKPSFIQAGAKYRFQGKTAALAKSSWSKKVKATYGPAWSDWKMASATSVACGPDGRGYHCIAKAKPCRLDLTLQPSAAIANAMGAGAKPGALVRWSRGARPRSDKRR